MVISDEPRNPFDIVVKLDLALGIDPNVRYPPGAWKFGMGSADELEVFMREGIPFVAPSSDSLDCPSERWS